MSPGFLEGYETVRERLDKFRDHHPDWGLHSEIVFDDADRILMRAEIWTADNVCVAVGHAEERRGPNRSTPAVETCETSAWGRALEAAGYLSSTPVRSVGGHGPRVRAESATTPSPRAAPPAKDTSPLNPPAAASLRARASHAGLDEQGISDVTKLLCEVAGVPAVELNKAPKFLARDLQNTFDAIGAGRLELDYAPDGTVSLAPPTPKGAAV